MNDPENRPFEINEASKLAVLKLSRELMREVETNGSEKFGVSVNQVGMFHLSVEGVALPVITSNIDGDNAFGIDSSIPNKPKLVVDRNKLINLDPEDTEVKEDLLHELSHYVHNISAQLINLVTQAIKQEWQNQKN